MFARKQRKGARTDEMRLIAQMAQPIKHVASGAMQRNAHHQGKGLELLELAQSEQLKNMQAARRKQQKLQAACTQQRPGSQRHRQCARRG